MKTSSAVIESYYQPQVIVKMVKEDSSVLDFALTLRNGTLSRMWHVVQEMVELLLNVVVPGLVFCYGVGEDHSGSNGGRIASSTCAINEDDVVRLFRVEDATDGVSHNDRLQDGKRRTA